MDKPAVTNTLNTTGKCCPMPMVETNQAIKGLTPGQVLEIVASDPGTRTDIPSWCRRTGNRLLSVSEDGGVFRYYVEKT
jgi:tRNA 2-thiouridine synthesizing protein A